MLPAEVRAAVRAASIGELIVLPTDTVYGIGTRPDDPAATARLFQAKRRPGDLELPVLVPSLGEAERIAGFDDRARRLAEAFWPGALTIVLPRTDASRAWELGGDRETVGVRMPRHPLTLAVLREAGPLAVTSANVSGEPTPSGCDELAGLFGEIVAVYLCEEAPLEGIPSTVVDLAHGEVAVLRAGAIAEEEIRAAVAD
ncbi:MAG: threonylcarbamoyl-AMP synthase [Actinobacteria bacterium]|nr:threonylcarbamoyl-AMP synthase [Actinomycetota bacterium]